MKHLSPALAIFALACQVEAPISEVETAALPVEQAGPGAGALDLEINGAIEAGATMTWIVSGAQPGERIFVLFDNVMTAGSFCPPVMNGLCADLPGASVMKATYANAEGMGVFSLTVPSVPAGEWFFQAVTLNGTASTSDVVGRYVRAATGTLVPFLFHDLYIDPTSGDLLGGFSIAGAFGDDTANPNLFACYAEGTEAGAPAGSVCPGCEYGFTLAMNGDFQEYEIDGECSSYFGVGPVYFNSLFPGGGWAGIAGGTNWGFDMDYPLGGGAYDTYAFFYDAAYGGWYPIGSVYSNLAGPYGSTNIFFGLGYNGPFTY